MRTNSQQSKLRLLLAAICLSTSGATICRAQDDAPAKLPTAAEVIAKYVEVTGGLEKYKAVKSLKQTGTLSIPAAGINGTMEVKVASPDKVLMAVELPGAGNESTGSNGETVWSDSTMSGTRLLVDKEAEQTKREADFRRMYDPASVYKSLEVTGVEDVEGEKCYELKITKNDGDTQMEYYSVKSGLQTKSITTAQSAMGPMEIESMTGEYKEFGGIKFPTKMIQKLPNGMEMVVEFSEIVINPELPADTFALPEKIQKLVKKEQEKAPAAESGDQAKKAEGGR